MIGKSQEVLVPLFERLGEIDAFIHDGEHSYEDGEFVGLFGVQKAVIEYTEKYSWKLYITKNEATPSWFVFIS